jgi:hypothetical protein
VCVVQLCVCVLCVCVCVCVCVLSRRNKMKCFAAPSKFFLWRGVVMYVAPVCRCVARVSTDVAGLQQCTCRSSQFVHRMVVGGWVTWLRLSCVRGRDVVWLSQRNRVKDLTGSHVRSLLSQHRALLSRDPRHPPQPQVTSSRHCAACLFSPCDGCDG